jgi:cellulose biosynthesis protein BcsQ
MPPKLRVWLVATLKGGVRKTTTVMELAFALSDLGYNVLVIDADAGTQGVTDWASQIYARGEELPFDVVQWAMSLGLIVPFIQKQARESGADIVLVDIGGEAADVLEQVVMIATMVISPVGHEPGEEGRLPATRSLISPSGVPMYVMLTRVASPGKGAAADLRKKLTEQDGYTVLKAETGQNRDKYCYVWGYIPEDRGAYDDAAKELLELEASNAR